jgi:hypothetical protein
MMQIMHNKMKWFSWIGQDWHWFENKKFMDLARSLDPKRFEKFDINEGSLYPNYVGKWKIYKFLESLKVKCIYTKQSGNGTSITVIYGITTTYGLQLIEILK